MKFSVHSDWNGMLFGFWLDGDGSITLGLGHWGIALEFSRKTKR